jgi:hopanoid biosynthesis associated RND transporter like protein HpnN
VQRGDWRHELVPRSLWALVRLAIAAPWITVLVALTVTGLALWYTATHLKLHTSRNALVPQKASYIQHYRAFQQTFADLDPLIVVIEPQQLERGKQFADALATRLRADGQPFARVTEKLDTRSLEGKKLLLLSPADLRTLTQRLEDAQDFLAALTAAPSLRQLLASMNQEMSQALVSHVTGGFFAPTPETPSTAEDPEPSLDVSFLTALFTEMDKAIATPETYRFQSPWASFFLKESDIFSQDGYLISQDDRFLFVLVEDRPRGRGFLMHAAPLATLRAHIQHVRQTFPEVQAGVTGSKALASDEMRASQRDNALASGIALAGVAALFMMGFREVRSPLLVVATLSIALCWTLGLTALTVGHFNILSISFAPILIGLADNFGVQLVARYGEERLRGSDFRAALALATHYTGPGILTAAGTVMLAFYAILLVDFPGLAELGFIAGSGIAMGLLASFTLLPALLALSAPYMRVYPGTWHTIPPDPLRRLRRFPRTTLGLCGLLTLVGLVLLPAPPFDYNLLRLQAEGTESVRWEYRLLEASARSSRYAMSIAQSLDDLYRKAAQFEALPVVEQVESLAPLLPADQDIRLALVRELAPLVEGLSPVWGQAAPIDLDDMTLLLQKMRFKLQRKASEWAPQRRPSEAALTAAYQALVALQTRWATTAPEVLHRALGPFQQALMADFADKLALVQRNVRPAGLLTPDDVPSYLRDRFVGHNGHYLLHLYARQDIWERDAMAAFVRQLQAVDANVTGAPVVAYYAIQQMQQGYLQGGFYALMAIVGLTWLDFRRLQPTLLALLPLALGALWIVPSMTMLGLQWNMANLVVLPMFMGIAVDCGVHLVHRAWETPETAATPLATSTGKAVLVSGLTTMVGFGSLLVARHAGIFSLGALLTLAIGCNLAAAFVVLPLVLYLFPPGHTRVASTRPSPPPPKTGASCPSGIKAR